MPIYPQKVAQRAASPINVATVELPDATGRAASFVCGCFAAFSIRSEQDPPKITDVAFQSNGCGFMTAAADVLSDAIRNSSLADLDGLKRASLLALIEAELDAFPPNRRQCGQICIEALHNAFRDLRARRIDGFRGEMALICTCFGVSDDAIERCLRQPSVRTVDDVADSCNAGSGCGSCRMLIQEMLDSHGR